MGVAASTQIILEHVVSGAYCLVVHAGLGNGQATMLGVGHLPCFGLGIYHAGVGYKLTCKNGFFFCEGCKRARK